MLLYNASFIIVGLACILFGVMFMVRRRARIFYGVHKEGKAAMLAGGFLVVVGLLVIAFGLFLLPELIDLQGLQEMVPELRQ